MELRSGYNWFSGLQNTTREESHWWQELEKVQDNGVGTMHGREQELLKYLLLNLLGVLE